MLGFAVLLCLLWAQPVTSAAAHSQSAVLASQAARDSSILTLASLEAAEQRLTERLEVQPADYDALFERVAVRVQLYRLNEAAKAIRTSQATYQAAYDHSRLREQRKQFYDAQSSADGADLNDNTLPPGGSRGTSGEGANLNNTLPPGGSRGTSGEGAVLDGNVGSPRQTPDSLPSLSLDPSAGRVNPETGNRSPETGPLHPSLPPSPLTLHSSPFLHAAAADARAALRVCPLSPEPRIWLARLDFITGETQLTATRLEQVAQLRSGSLVTLGRVVDSAVQSRNWSVARDAWKQTIHLSVGRTAAVLARVRAETPLRPSDVVPDERAAILAAAESELKHPDPDPILLAAAKKHLTPALSDQERALKQKIEKIGVR